MKSSQVNVSKERSGDSPGSRQHSGEVHLSHQDEVPGTQHTVNRLQLLVQEVEHRLGYTVTDIQSLEPLRES